MRQCTRYYYLILQKRKLRPIQDKWISQSHTLGLIQSQVYLLQSLHSSHWANASCLASHLLLLGLFYCWTSHLLNKTINSTSTRTMLPISFEHAWHRTGAWVDAQKMFAECKTALKKWPVKAKNHKHWSTWNKQIMDKIAQVMTCTWIPSAFKKCFLASLITLDSSVQGLGLNRSFPQF